MTPRDAPARHRSLRPRGRVPALRGPWAAAELEQVLTTTARIDLADADSWLREWTAAGGEAWAAARQEDQPGSFLHAASYYGAALALIAESDGLVDEAALWTRQRECWEHAVSDLGGEQWRSRTRRRRFPASSSPEEQAADR